MYSQNLQNGRSGQPSANSAIIAGSVQLTSLQVRHLCNLFTHSDPSAGVHVPIFLVYVLL